MIQPNRTLAKINIKSTKFQNPLASVQLKSSSRSTRYIPPINQIAKTKSHRHRLNHNNKSIKNLKAKEREVSPPEIAEPKPDSDKLSKSLLTNTQYQDPLPSINSNHINGYNTYRFLGSGAFGSVFSAFGKNGRVAIKKVKIDKQYINREVEILKMLNSVNCLKLIDSYTITEQSNHINQSASSIPTLIKLNSDNKTSDFENAQSYFSEHNNNESFQQKKTSENIPHIKDSKTVANLMDIQQDSTITYQYIVTEQMPYSLKQYLDQLYSMKIKIDPLLMKLFIYNLFAGLSYLHSLGITHRDIKTCNLLVNDHTGELKICDFGSAKIINGSYKNGSDFDISVSYIASRMFRAPELLLDCCKYGGAIDIWAAGCVICEILNESMPMFMGSSNSDQLIQIMRILGKPTKEDIESFEHSLEFPEVEQISCFKNVLPINIDQDLFELLSKIFVYNPAKRPTAKECMMSPYFDELFVEGKTLSDGRPLPTICPR